MRLPIPARLRRRRWPRRGLGERTLDDRAFHCSAAACFALIACCAGAFSTALVIVLNTAAAVALSISLDRFLPDHPPCPSLKPRYGMTGQLIRCTVMTASREKITGYVSSC